MLVPCRWYSNSHCSTRPGCTGWRRGGIESATLLPLGHKLRRVVHFGGQPVAAAGGRQIGLTLKTARLNGLKCGGQFGGGEQDDAGTADEVLAGPPGGG